MSPPHTPSSFPLSSSSPPFSSPPPPLSSPYSFCGFFTLSFPSIPPSLPPSSPSPPPLPSSPLLLFAILTLHFLSSHPSLHSSSSLFFLLVLLKIPQVLLPPVASSSLCPSLPHLPSPAPFFPVLLSSSSPLYLCVSLIWYQRFIFSPPPSPPLTCAHVFVLGDRVLQMFSSCCRHHSRRQDVFV